MSPRIFPSISCLTLLFILFIISLTSGLQAQQASASDTMAYLIKTQNDPIALCDALNKVGNYYWSIGDFESAFLVETRTKELADKNKYEKGLYDAWSILAAIALKQGDFDKALSIANESLAQAKKTHNEYGVNKAYYIIAINEYQHRNLDSVISLSRRVLDAPHIVYDSNTLPRFVSLLASAYMTKGDLKQSNQYNLEALDLAEKTKNESLQSVCLANLALINQILKNDREALRYQRKGLDMALKNNQVRAAAGIYFGMASSYQNLSILDSAVFFYKKALPLFKQVDSKPDIAIINSNLGALMVSQQQPDSGMYFLTLAKHDFILLNDTVNIATNSLNMGDALYRIAVAKNDMSYVHSALAEFLTCKQLAELKGIEDLKMNCYHYLSMVYESLGNTTQAYDYLKRYNLINDAIRSKEYTGQIAEVQTKYATEKKENEIIKLNTGKSLDAEKIARQKTFNYSLLTIAALLLISGFLIFKNVQHKRMAEKQVAILEKQNAIESMRTKIASDVHDEMGANLTRLGLNAQQLLQIPTIPEQGKQLVEKMAAQSKDIITGMREIIWASNPANDNLKSMLGFMRQYIDRFFDGTNIRTVVNFPHEVGEVTLHPEVRRNLFLILKESLNNAVKYSGSDRIDIDFRNENESFNLNIKDYGKGIDEQNKDAFSNGLHNMKMRAELIQSLFKLITAPGQGVQISVEGKLY